MLHKPSGFVCTRKDLHARDTIYDLLPTKLARLFNVGRLDAMTEGLIILTNDGELSLRLTHPRYKVEKEYEVIMIGHGMYALEENSCVIPRRATRSIRPDPSKDEKTPASHPQTGINRQIRRMFEAVGYKVKQLVRTRIGCFGWRSATGPLAPLTRRELIP